ncbi:PhzF family phenazine biosynthesis protein [Marinobacter sp.]|uniref:PhzF family phenazine biosynthesis protein n=1 Tax=Marinobacter sp. TaxID=50741 RepID=UPI003851415D
MATFSLYQVDAFTDSVFGGNPAAIVPLEQWLDDGLMQKIAKENNLSETAFFVPEPEGAEYDFHIRWFTPGAEVPLCGHATLATAWVLFNRLGWNRDSLLLRSKSGPLGITRKTGGWLELDFPNLAFEETATPELVRKALPGAPATAFFVPSDTNYMLVLDNEAAVREAAPDMDALRALGNQGLIITAAGEKSDFVSRYFAPGFGIDEDPVTGSIHCVLTPYWAEKLARETLVAHQVSSRGGILKCTLNGDRVGIAGQVAFYMEGSIQV